MTDNSHHISTSSFPLASKLNFCCGVHPSEIRIHQILYAEYTAHNTTSSAACGISTANITYTLMHNTELGMQRTKQGHHLKESWSFL